MANPAARGDIPRMNWLERLIRWAFITLYRLAGWKPKGQLPPDPKFVIMGACHTSNWDFLVFLGTIHALGRQVHFVGKHSLFRWPMAASCVPSAVFRRSRLPLGHGQPDRRAVPCS
jgi:1-acyl-sn-glycerol-3-phosphate acyltransferase